MCMCVLTSLAMHTVLSANTYINDLFLIVWYYLWLLHEYLSLHHSDHDIKHLHHICKCNSVTTSVLPVLSTGTKTNPVPALFIPVSLLALELKLEL